MPWPCKYCSFAEFLTRNTEYPYVAVILYSDVSSFGDVAFLTLQMSVRNDGAMQTEMSYCKDSKEMSSLYFGLEVFCPIEARFPRM
jgi:hypothetical protein